MCLDTVELCVRGLRAMCLHTVELLREEASPLLIGGLNGGCQTGL